jgi:hypothetical protein
MQGWHCSFCGGRRFAAVTSGFVNFFFFWGGASGTLHLTYTLGMSRSTVPVFIDTLWEAIETGEFGDGLHWTHDGQAFVISSQQVCLLFAFPFHVDVRRHPVWLGCAL